MTLKKRFVEVLQQDIALFAKMAESFESLIPALASIEQKQTNQDRCERMSQPSKAAPADSKAG